MSNVDKNIQLGKEEKERILAEEIFREEVRREITRPAAPLKVYQKIWASRDSGFTLWLLSSVVLAVITWSYTQWEGVRSERRQAESEFRTLAMQAAESLEALQGAVTAHRVRVEHYLHKNIRRLERFYYIIAMQESAKANASASHAHEVRNAMRKAGGAAERAFRIWMDVAPGDDVDSRAQFLQELHELRREKKSEEALLLEMQKSAEISEYEELSAVIARKDEKTFFLVTEAIRRQVLLQNYGKETGRLADTIARHTSEVRSAKKGIVLAASGDSWLGKTPPPIWEHIGNSDFWASLIAVYEAGVSLRMQGGGIEEELGGARLSDLSDKTRRSDAILGLTRLELAYAKQWRVENEREQARVGSIKDSTQRLFDAVAAAESLTLTVSEELTRLKNRKWSRNESEIPRLTQVLKQRTQYALALRDDVPEDIVALEKEAEAEMAASRAYLGRVLQYSDIE